MEITQVYVDTEPGINRWLKENSHLDVVDIKLAANNDGEVIMIVYKEYEADEQYEDWVGQP